MFLAIKQLLLTNPEVNGIVADRIYPDVVPENKDLPSISMFQVNDSRSDLVEGTPLATQSNWQINCVANTRKDSSELADAVIRALHQQQGEGIKRLTVTNRNDDLPAAGASIRSTIVDVSVKHY